MAAAGCRCKNRVTPAFYADSSMAGRPEQPLPPHGSRARYQHRRQPCSCPECTGANARYQAAYRRGAETPPTSSHTPATQLSFDPRLTIRVGR